MGDFTNIMPGQDQLDSLVWLVNDLLIRVPTIETITNHHGSCPGSHIVEFIGNQWDIFRLWR